MTALPRRPRQPRSATSRGDQALSRRIRAAAVVRAGWGCVLVLVPGRVLRIGGEPPAPPVAVAVARVLGVRQVLQAAMTAAKPTGPVVGVGAAVDAVHAGTDVGVAAMSVRWRRIALIDAMIAAGLVASGWTARRRAGCRSGDGGGRA